MVNDKLGKLLGAASELPLDSTTDWKILQCFLPLNWQEQSRNLGAIQRCKKFASPEVLLRTLLIHLASGCSLRETVVRARQAKLVDVSDVALLKRLRTSGQWLQWMAKEVMNTWTTKQPSAIHSPELKIRIIDGTMLAEPGATGTTWRIHYSIQLPELACDEVHITSPQQGESTKHFREGLNRSFFLRRSSHGGIFRGRRCGFCLLSLTLSYFFVALMPFVRLFLHNRRTTTY